MMRLSLVVAGAPALATALDESGQFAQVHSVNSTMGLRDLIVGGILKGDNKDGLVFLFADNLKVDTPQTPLSTLLGKLTSSGYHVAIIALTPNGRDIVKSYPGSGILEGPFSVNDTIGAIAGMPGIEADLSPVEGGSETFDVTGRTPRNRPAPAPEAAIPPAPRVPDAGGFGGPAPFGSPPAAGGFSAPPAPFAPPAAREDRTAKRPAPVAEEPKRPAFTPPPAPFGTPQDTPAFGAAPAQDPKPATWSRKNDEPAPFAPPQDAPAFGGPAPFAPPQSQAPAPFAPPQDAPAFGGPAPFAPPQDAPAFGGPAPFAPPQSQAPAPFAPPQSQAPAFGGPAPFAPPQSEPAGFGPPAGFAAPPAPFAPPQDAPAFGGPAPFAPPQDAPAFGGPMGMEESGPVARGNYGAQAAVRKRRGFVITITAPKGGTGKSSLTLNLACYLGLRLKAQGMTVCVIDTNFQQADTGKYLNEYTPNITHIVRDQTALQRDRIGAHLVHKPEYGISALLGPANPLEASPVYINAQLYTQILVLLRELYDYILIDTPVAEKFHDIFIGFALPEADFIVVPVAPNVPTLMNADGWLQAITSSRHTGGDGVDPNKIGVVLNRAKANIDCSEEEVRQELAQWNFIGSIPETDEWQRANNNNEIVAMKNYAQLNEAFAQVLYRATGEEALRETAAPIVEKSSITSKLFKMLKKK